MNVSLTLYALKHLRENKNFVIDNEYGGFDNFLSSDSISGQTLAISSFQFQRFDLEKKIKVNASQLNSINIKGSNRWNYCKITVSYDSEDTPPEFRYKYYYYFVTKITQISQMCVELELKMDVLNTFTFVNTRTADGKESQYTLSEKTLITRQHKDRFLKAVENRIYLNDFSDLELNQFILLSDSFINSLDSTPQVWTFDNGVVNEEYPPNICFFLLKVYDENDELVYETPTNAPICHSLSFKYETGTTSIVIRFIVQIGGIWQLGFVTQNITGRPSKIEIKFIQFPQYLPSSLVDVFDDFINKTNCYYVNYNYGRDIDRFPEGIETILFQDQYEDSGVLVEQNDYENTWYIAYASQNSVVGSPSDTEATFVNPVQIVLYSDNGYGISIHGAITRRIRAIEIPKYPQYEEYLEIELTNLPAGAYVEVAGVRYDNSYAKRYLFLQKKNDTDVEFRRVFANDSDTPNDWEVVLAQHVEYIDCYGFNDGYLWTGINDATIYEYIGIYGIGAGETTTAYTSDPISEVDLTDPKLIKIINFPYAPREDLINIKVIPTGMVWNSDKGAFEIQNTRYINFDRTLNFPSSPYRELFAYDIIPSSVSKRMSRQLSYESKLFNSDFYTPKFVYDSFAFPFRLEMLDHNEFFNNNGINTPFYVRYVISTNVNSKMMFQFPQYYCKYASQDFNNVLIIERNNEIALYTNAYINYIKSGGFAHDSKNADTQKLTNGLILALSTIGAVGSFASSAVTGGVGIAGGIALSVGTATKTISAIVSAQQADRDIAQKLLSTAQQSTSVSSSEDISIMRAYSSNKAKLCFYKVSDFTKNALWDLFHYFGYKCHEYGIPNVKTRCNFNFVQAEIQLDEYSFDESIAEEIAKKWKEGITFIHRNVISSVVSYDINQEYENVENSLLDWIEED